MKKEFTAMIVDDEPEAINYLKALLNEGFPEIEITATAAGIEEAVKKAFRKHPDIVFLDVNFETKNGFDFIKEMEQNNHVPYIIFITAYEKYALDAFKTKALAYLLKPVDPEDLRLAINKFVGQQEKDNLQKDILNLVNNYQPKIRFNTRSGFILLSPAEIVYCEADGNYTQIHLKDQSKTLVSQNLSRLVTQLPAQQFSRISRFYIINESYLAEVDRSKLECRLSVNGQDIKLKYSPGFFKGV